jgi:GT2 family glycosyltransferase
MNFEMRNRKEDGRESGMSTLPAHAPISDLSVRASEFGCDVSVCIVNWNCQAHLRACLLSLREEAADVSMEVIVVDNGSTDGAADMTAEDFPEVVLIRNQDNLGFSHANNQAARQAQGRYLFFLNNDTIVPPGTLNRLLAYARAFPEVGIVGPQLRDEHGQAQVSYRSCPSLGAMLHRISWLRWTGLFRCAYRRYRGRDIDAPTPRRVDVLMGAALFMPRGVFRNCGAWDEDYTFGGEDIDLCDRVGQHHPVIYHPGIVITHFGRVSSRQHIGYAYSKTVVGVTRYLRKRGCSPYGLFVYKLALTLDAPVQWLGHALRYGWRRMCGQSARAAKSRLALRGLGHFLTRELAALWRI